MARSSQARGTACGLAAAALFGLSAPIAKLLLPSSGPLVLACLLYLGGGLGLTLADLVRRAVRPGRRTEAPLTRRDVPALLGIIACGGMAGPLLMLAGLNRLSALSASMLLNLEGPFTVLLAVAVFHEHLGRRALLAAALIFAGSVPVGLGGGQLQGDLLGVLALAGACAAWAVDNNLTQRLSIKDPVSIVRWKGLGGGGAMLLLALGLGYQFPRPAAAGAAAVLGLLSYGLSVVLSTFAFRLLGAARQAALFATAPFIGAMAAVPILGDRPTTLDWLGGAAIASGVFLLVRDQHSHRHAHAPLHHNHEHVHDEHHRHAHEGPWSEPHSHPHQHEALTHEHPHVSDVHHRHEHPPEK